MIGGIIATHAGLANGFLEAVEMIAGKQENLLAVSLREGDGLEILIERLQKAAASMEGEDPLKAQQCHRILAELPTQHLDRHLTVQYGIDCQIDIRHTAFPQ